MKKALILLFVIPLVSSTIHAQSTKVQIPVEFYRNVLRDGGLPPNVVGSPYVNEDFQSGKVFIKDSESYPAMLRYDAYRDNIEMQDNGKTISLLKRDYIRAEINGDKYAIFSFNAENERAKQGYFVQLTSGPLILLKKITKEFKPATETTSTYKREQPPRFADDIEYYLFSTNEEVAKSIKLRKKSILKVLDNQMEASKIIKERKLDLSEENGVIQMITILNSTTNNSK